VHPLDRAAPGVGHPGEQLRLGAGSAVQRVEQQFVGAPQRPGLSLPDQHRGAGRQASQELVDQAGFPDARLAGNHRDVWTRGRDEPRQLTQLAAASDHDRTNARARGPHLARVPVRADKITRPDARGGTGGAGARRTAADPARRR
jgi:hypothetical protein